MKIAFFETEELESTYVKDKLKKHELKFFDGVLNEKNVGKVKDFDAICVFIHSEINKNVLDKLKAKLICTISTGFDHIDLDECKKRRIKVYNVPDYAEDTVSEHTFALILNLSRKIHESQENFKEGEIDSNKLRGFDLKDKTLGIIGVGAIGHKVAKIAKSFEMKVIAFDVVKNFNVKYVSLDYLLGNSDIITLHCPLNEHTKGMIGVKEINKMNKDAIFINTARGELVDNNALIKAVKANKIKGIGLDVFENEEGIREHPKILFNKVKNLKNVIFTPHNAFNSEESIRRLLDQTIENLKGGRNARIA